jgi:hypothetical protein
MIIECKECGSPKIENRDLGLCSSCNKARRKSGKIEASDNHTSINKHSEKGSKVNQRYLTRLRTWKRGKKCVATFEHECSDILECHHMGGRSNDAYWDEWAQENDVVLTLDERLWMPLCDVAHRYVTEHSRWACENGYSFKRVTDPIFRR